MRLLLLVLLVGCGGPAKTADIAPAEPAPFEGRECAVCSMTVADQPSPRGQVAHRDGSHAHFCSVGDLLHYLGTPGPKGAPTDIWVEAMPADLDPAAHDTAPQPWVAPEEAAFTLGKDRRVMGTPVLSYRKGEAGTLSWSQLKGQMKW